MRAQVPGEPSEESFLLVWSRLEPLSLAECPEGFDLPPLTPQRWALEGQSVPSPLGSPLARVGTTADAQASAPRQRLGVLPQGHSGLRGHDVGGQE